MTTTAIRSYGIQDATSPLWVGRWPGGWGHVVHGVDSGQARTAAAMIATAGLAWTVEQHPLEAVLGNPDGDGESQRVPVPRVVANVRSDTGAVLGVVGDTSSSRLTTSTRSSKELRLSAEIRLRSSGASAEW